MLKKFLWIALGTLLLDAAAQIALGQAPGASPTADPSDVDRLLTGELRWKVEPPFLEIQDAHLPASPEHPWIAVKDPSVVRFEDRWHLFCTLRKRKSGDGRIRIGYMAFEDWSDASQTDWHVLELTSGYHGAPQIFYFEPHAKWYLIYQATDETRGLRYGPCFSTNATLGDAQGWTLPEPLYVVPEGVRAGLDYWIICDESKVHLFFTTLDGKMWRSETLLMDFPNKNWSKPEIALQADIFEASHTYKLSGTDKFLTFVEAQDKRRRYFKAFLADKLEGPWSPLAASREKPFVSPVNVVNQAESWASSYSHGELIRSGFNQQLEVDPHALQLLFQGASDRQYQRGNYGDIPWRLGILKQAE